MAKHLKMYKITNKTGMRLRYAGVKFEPKESKVLDLDSAYEHEYFDIKKLNKKHSKKLNEKTEKKKSN